MYYSCTIIHKLYISIYYYLSYNNSDLIHIKSYILMWSPPTSANVLKTEFNNCCSCKGRDRKHHLCLAQMECHQQDASHLMRGRLMALPVSRLRMLGQESRNLLWPPSSRESHNLSDRQRITLVDSTSFNSTKNTQKLSLPGCFHGLICYKSLSLSWRHF